MKAPQGDTWSGLYARQLGGLAVGDKLHVEKSHLSMVSCMCRAIEGQPEISKTFKGYSDEEGHWIIRKT